MVFDASSAAFPQLGTPNKSPAGVHVQSIAKPTVPQSLPDATDRPTKRRRTLQNGLNTSLTTSSPGPSSVSTGLDFDALDAARRRSSARVMSLWESLAARYARPLDEDDEIDILTGKIYKDRGVLRAASERGWRIGSFGEAIEVEPVGGASEAETDTGTSECDDETEEVDNAGDTDGVDEEDEFEAWSYDWQYRKIPPPRPELSPQDAEDLEEFLAAESAIQKDNARKNDGKPSSQDDDDEVVYLGDSMHDQDGALLGDSDDDEFSSFAVDDSTIQLSKREEEEEDVVEPMASILGALAIGKTPQKSSSTSKHVDVLRNTGSGVIAGSQDQQEGTRAASAPSSCTVYLGASLMSTYPGSEARVEDELIIIESDTEEEVDADMSSPSKIRSVSRPPRPLTSFAAQSPPKTPLAERSGGSLHGTTQSKATIQSSEQNTPIAAPLHILTGSDTDTIPEKRASFSAMVAALQASAITDTPNGNSDSIPVGSSCSTTFLSKTVKPISKRMRSRETAKTMATEETSSEINTPGPRTLARDTIRTVAGTSTKPFVNSTLAVPHKVAHKALSRETDKPDGLLGATSTKPKNVSRQAAKQSVDSTRPKPAGKGGTIGATKSSSMSTPAPIKNLNSALPVASPTLPSRSARVSSPAKCKKPLVMEVVLTPSRRAPRPIPQSSKPYTLAVSVSSHAGTHTASSESSSTSETKPTARGTTNREKHNEPSDSVGQPSTRLLANDTRKRRRESSEGFKARDAMLEPDRPAALTLLEQPQTIGRLHPCCPSLSPQTGQNQPLACYSTPLGCISSPQPTHECQHSHPRGSCSHSHTHQCSGIHQHQHQHVHTHLPFPLPQHIHQFTANELTEAALKLMYGLGTMRSGDSGAFGHGIWLPPGTNIPNGEQAKAGISAQVSPPKLEREPSSQELVLGSQERVPSSQESERRKEEELLERQVQAHPGPTECKDTVSSHSYEPASRSAARKHAFSPDRSTVLRGQDVDLSSTLPKISSPPKMQPPKRESSVIDIESDSDDELAGFNAGEGSIRWEPAIKDESDSEDGGLYAGGSDDDIMLLSTPEGKSRRRLRTRKAHKDYQQTSPSKPCRAR